ncbi:MAG TPA: hypothetical protein VMZ03_10300 [Chitinophagaceae bacterium]|nr:hypothetical protein [Chitinophagaceae bacterium]
MLKRWLLAFSLLPLAFVNAQQFGGNPPSQKWQQINTDTARIIFPAGMDSSANRVASLVHYLAAQKPFSLGDQLKKVNIVLQNSTVISNGYVGLGPFRSEFFLTPDLNNHSLGSINWTDQLALHEYRHVQQLNNFNNGLSKLMKVISGEQGYDLAINAAIPSWFFEGDAVYNETVLSQQGRGRLPLFVNAYPSLWQAGKKYSWMKLRNGSFKDYVPNHYYLGYLLVNYGREKYGTDFWTKVTRDASAYKGLIYPFQLAVKRYAGVNYENFRKEAFEFYKKKTERVAETRDEYLLPVNKNYVTSYLYPYTAGADSLIYLRTDYRHRPAFYVKDKEGEHKLKTRDISVDDQFSYRNGKIVYAAYESDPRWSWKDYSVIKLLDVQTGQERSLKHKTRYFTPDISADGSKVAAVQANAQGKSELHVLNSASGEVITKIQSRDITLFTDPKFTEDNNIVTAVRLIDGKMALAMAETATGILTRLTSPSFNVVGNPGISAHFIYFTASYNGNDDVFALRMSDKKIFRITDGPLGNYYVSVANGRISWSTFTAEGFQLRQMNEKDMVWNEVPEATAVALTEKFSVSHANAPGDILLKLPQRQFTSSKYKKGTKLLNLHSWRPYYSDPIFTYSIYGENVLNTLQTELFYSYNQNDKTNSVGLFATYGALFPHITGGTEYTFDNETEVGNRIRRWAQLDTRVGLMIPLNYASGKTYKDFSAGSYYILRNEFNKDFYKDSLGNTSFGYLLHSLSWTQQVQRAVQHIYPRFAYSLSMNHRHAISNVEGYQFIGNATLYVPGLLSTHNLVLAGSFQQRDTLGQLVFSNRFAYSRGYEGRYFSRMWRLSANYHLPLFYPDWGFGNILYLMRIRANAFYDFTKVYSRDKSLTADQRSVGGEIFLDTKWWNQYPLTFGFRISRLLDPDQLDGKKGTIFEFVLPVNIIPR